MGIPRTRVSINSGNPWESLFLAQILVSFGGGKIWREIKGIWGGFWMRKQIERRSNKNHFWQHHSSVCLPCPGFFPSSSRSHCRSHCLWYVGTPCQNYMIAQDLYIAVVACARVNTSGNRNVHTPCKLQRWSSDQSASWGRVCRQRHCKMCLTSSLYAHAFPKMLRTPALDHTTSLWAGFHRSVALSVHVWCGSWIKVGMFVDIKRFGIPLFWLVGLIWYGWLVGLIWYDFGHVCLTKNITVPLGCSIYQFWLQCWLISLCSPHPKIFWRREARGDH